MTDNAKPSAADLAEKSGLFGAPKPDTAPAQSEKPTPPKPPTTEKPISSHKAPQKKQPCKARGVKSTDSTPNQHKSHIPAQAGDTSDEPYTNEQTVFNAIKQAASLSDKLSKAENSAVFVLSREISQRFDGLQKRAESAEKVALSRAPASLEAPLGKDELEGIIVRLIRSDGATETGVKALSTVLERMQPDLFRDETHDRKPDPAAVLGYVTSFAGMTGAQIVESIGGREFMAAQLADILKTDVILPDPVD